MNARANDGTSRTALVTGGAGYIGSHVVLALREAGWGVVVVDDLSAGSRTLVPEDVPLVIGSVGDHSLMRRVLTRHGCRAVLHFAGSVSVSESVAEPLAYYRNNTFASLGLIEACVDVGLKHFVFSSTASVYGEPDTVPVDELAPLRPVSPYGRSKLMTEWILRDTAKATGLRYAALRYFNVAGADPQGRSGQATSKATHLIRIAAQTVAGRRDAMSVYGEDYDTPDGTCVRDYVHVSDLAAAHVAVLEHLVEGGDNLVLNCGNGDGFSVRQVLDVVQEVAGKRLRIESAPRRQGDVPVLVAEVRRIREVLGWRPRFDDLATIVRDAIEWERRLLDHDGGQSAPSVHELAEMPPRERDREGDGRGNQHLGGRSGG